MAKKPAKPLRTGPPDASCRVLLVAGKEAFLREEYTRQLKALLQAAHGELDIHHFDGADADLAEVLDELRTSGLLAAHKLVIVRDAEKLVVGDDRRRAMERFAEHPSETATLVLQAETWRPGKLDEMIAAVGAIPECDQIAPSQAINWVVRRAQKSHNATIGRDAAQLLVDHVGVDLLHLDSELAKLAPTAGAEITAADVKKLVGRTREEALWDIQLDLLAGDPAHAARRVRDAIEVSRHSPVAVAYALMDAAKKLHAVARAKAQGESPARVAGQIRLWGESKDWFLRAGAVADPVAAAALLDDCIQMDAAQKSGLRDPERALERLAVRFAELAGGRRRPERSRI